jgi:hypothetical protein
MNLISSGFTGTHTQWAIAKRTTFSTNPRKEIPLLVNDNFLDEISSSLELSWLSAESIEVAESVLFCFILVFKTVRR